MRVRLSQGQYAQFDLADAPLVMAYHWCAQWSPRTRSFYAVASVTADGKRRRIYMHRLILGMTWGDGRQGDHKRVGHTLDNRRRNLREATHSQNQQNKRISRNNTTGFKGVSFKRGKYEAQIRNGGPNIYLGRFNTAEEAGAAYRAASKRLHGGFSNLQHHSTQKEAHA